VGQNGRAAGGGHREDGPGGTGQHDGAQGAKLLAGAPGAAWPAARSETLEWRFSDLRWAESNLSRRAIDALQGPYDACVPADIATAGVQIPAGAAVLMEEAMIEMVRFDLEASAAPAPMPSVLLRSESACSSQIENLTASARQIALSTLGAGARHNAELIAANVRAMEAALAIPKITAQGTLEIHAALMGRAAPQLAGRWRDEPVWIGTSGWSPIGAAFVPPKWERVPELMDDLSRFAARTDVPTLAQAAIAHAQFETIHPFADGNGRTGRVLIHTLFRRGGLAPRATIPVSAGLLAHVGEYVAALEAYRRGDAEPIIRRVAEAALAAVAGGRAMLADIREVQDQWMAVPAVRRNPTAVRLANALFAQPAVNGAFVVEALGVAPSTALNAIDILEQAGVLVQCGGYKRDRTWEAPRALRVLEGFAARAARRPASRRLA
jgi:Fic family protein